VKHAKIEPKELLTVDENLIELTSTFSASAFSALLATLDARETLALFDPAFGQPWKQRQAIYRRIARIHADGVDVSVAARPLADSLEDDRLRDNSLL